MKAPPTDLPSFSQFLAPMKFSYLFEDKRKLDLGRNVYFSHLLSENAAFPSSSHTHIKGDGQHVFATTASHVGRHPPRPSSRLPVPVNAMTMLRDGSISSNSKSNAHMSDVV